MGEGAGMGWEGSPADGPTDGSPQHFGVMGCEWGSGANGFHILSVLITACLLGWIARHWDQPLICHNPGYTLELMHFLTLTLAGGLCLCEGRSHVGGNRG